MAANEYPGPAVIICYAVCQPEHGVADDASWHQAKLAEDSRTFPLLLHDPRKGPLLKDRLSLPKGTLFSSWACRWMKERRW